MSGRSLAFNYYSRSALMATFTETVVTSGAGDGECECCGIDVGCTGCESIPATWIFTISATGDLAFLDGGTVTIGYAGYSGGYFNWLGTATIAGCEITVGWGMEDTSTCSVVFGDISVDCLDCTGGPQSFDGGAVAGSWSFSCATPSFSCALTELLQFPIDRCYFGTIGGEALSA